MSAATRPERRRWLWPAQPLVAHLGSPRTTLVALALLAAVVLADPSRQPLVLAIGLLVANLGAALVWHPGLRRHLPLLVAHLALLALVGLVGWGRLAALDGRFELVDGVPFDGQLLDQRAGPLYRPALQRLQFAHQGFEIDYAPGRKRGATRNPVAWRDASGALQRAVIGDHRPLVLDGHRITTSPNKGFAPVLRWQPDQGSAIVGAVHLPSFPVHELQQSRAWALPDGREAWVQLHTDEALIDPSKASRFVRPRTHRLVLRVGDQRVELVPGQALHLPGGQLVYERLGLWMGYRVAHDPSLPWLLAAALLFGLSMAAHYARKFSAPPAAQAAGASTGVGHE